MKPLLKLLIYVKLVTGGFLSVCFVSLSSNLLKTQPPEQLGSPLLSVEQSRLTVRPAALTSALLGGQGPSRASPMFSWS